MNSEVAVMLCPLAPTHLLNKTLFNMLTQQLVTKQLIGSLGFALFFGILIKIHSIMKIFNYLDHFASQLCLLFYL